MTRAKDAFLGESGVYDGSLTNRVYSPNNPALLLNTSLADQTGFAADTYLLGSNITVPTTRIKATTMYRLWFDVTKTAAGTAGPAITLRYGTTGSVTDSAKCAFTWSVGTAATDDAVVEVTAAFHTVGGSAVIQGVGEMRHKVNVTGFNTTAYNSWSKVTSAAFDSTVANSIIGVSVNGGTSAAWTVKLVTAQLFGLT